MYTIKMGANVLYDSTNRDDYPLVSPKLHLELNSAGDLEFTVLPNHPLYNQIKKMRTFVTVFQDDEELFYGRVLSTEKDLFGQLNVHCEGALTFLLDSELEKMKVTETVEQFFARCINAHNEQVEDAKKFTIGEVSIGKLLDSEFHALSESLQTNYFQLGNVDLLNRPQISESDLEAAGWEDAGTGIATVFSTAYNAGTRGLEWNQNAILHMTPIKADGTVLSPDQLDSYVEDLLTQTTPESVLSYDADHSNLVLWVQAVSGKWEKATPIGEKFDDLLHRLQEAYYLEDYSNFPSEKELREFNSNIFAPELNGAKANEKMEFKIESFSTIKSALETFFLKKHGGYFRVRYNPNGYHFLDYVSHYGVFNTQRIRIAENIIDKTDNTTGDNLFTILRPIGKNNLTIENLDQSKIALSNVTKSGSKLILDDMVSEYGKIIHTENFSDIDDAMTLLRAAEDFIKRRGSQLPSTCDANIVDFHVLNPEIQRVALGDMFTDIEGFDGQEMTVAVRDIDLEDPGKDSLIFKNKEEIALNDAGSSSGSLSASYASKCTHIDYIYKFIREEEGEIDKLILSTQQIDIGADRINQIANYWQVTAEEEPDKPGTISLKVRKFQNTDSEDEETELIMTLGNVELKNGNLIVSGYVKAAELQAEIANLDGIYCSDIRADEVDANVVDASTINTGTLEVGGLPIGGRNTLDVVTAVNYTPIMVIGADGSPVTVNSFNSSTKSTINYVEAGGA